jgi:hypothetical protein
MSLPCVGLELYLLLDGKKRVAGVIKIISGGYLWNEEWKTRNEGYYDIVIHGCKPEY